MNNLFDINHKKIVITGGTEVLGHMQGFKNSLPQKGYNSPWAGTGQKTL
ncbi:hypothetical protein L0P88_15250 [Muricauda sp. SCSIO 64092]|nr:hypothetical protein [Muricauda sp. SCSIO 64092]UOY05301.1 hypothetical protein L0P88_15250 [Muricauda sp. SCSIO 64092]